MTPAQRRVVVTLGFCGLVSAADNWFVSPALPAIAHALAVLPSVAAIVLTAYLVPYGLLQPVCGAIGDRVGRLRLLRVIVMGLAISTVVCAFAPTLEALVAARILTGCFAAGIISVSQALVGDTVSAAERAGAVGILMGITFTGQGLSAGLGGLLTDLVGWRAAFVAFGLLGVAAWMGLMRLPQRGADVAAPSGEGAPSDGASPLAVVGDFLGSAGRTFFGSSRAVFLAACSTGIVYLGIYGFMGTFLAERCGLAPTAAGLVMMSYGVACLVGGAISGPLGSRVGLRGVIATGEVAGLVSAGLLGAATLAGSWLPALGAAALLGLGYILVQPTLVSLSIDANPRQAGLCTGLVGLGVFVGGGVGSVLGQLAFGAGGYPVLWAGAAAVLLAQALLFARRPA